MSDSSNALVTKESGQTVLKVCTNLTNVPYLRSLRAAYDKFGAPLYNISRKV